MRRKSKYIYFFHFLWQNIHNIEVIILTIFKCTHSHYCAQMISTIHVQNLSSSAETLYSLSINSLFSLPDGSRQPQLQFLSLWIWPLCVPHINGIIQYFSFCDCLISLSLMFSGFFHFGVSVRISLLRLNNISLYVYVKFCLSVHQLMDTRVAILRMLLGTCMYKSKSLLILQPRENTN